MRRGFTPERELALLASKMRHGYKCRSSYVSTDNSNQMSRLRETALTLAQDRGIIRWRDFAAAGVTSATLARMVDDGEIERVGRGLYRLVDFTASENQSLIEAAKAAPRAAVCLLSALRVHDLTTQLPHAVWLMIGRKDRAPTSASRLQIVRASGAALTEGIMQVLQDGVEIKLTTPAKTVADCFKYRNRVGLDVAIEALRDGLQRKAFTVDDFMRMAEADRVARIARPYLEALV